MNDDVVCCWKKIRQQQPRNSWWAGGRFLFSIQPPVSSYPYESRSRRKHDLQTRAGWPISSNFILNPLPYFSLFFQFSPANLGGKILLAAEFLRQNFRFLIRYSNVNILSFLYQNQATQKLKFIYTCRTTTFMKDSRWDKIILQNRIGPQFGW